MRTNVPHIRELQKYNLRYILSVKPGDHAFRFDQEEEAIEAGKANEFSMPDPHKPEILHYFRFINGVPLNKSNQDLLANLLQY